VLGRNLPIAGGAYFRIFPYALTRTALRSINREGKPVVFYIHPWEIDPEHPRIPLPARIAATHYFNLKATEGRLRRLESPDDVVLERRARDAAPPLRDPEVLLDLILGAARSTLPDL